MTPSPLFGALIIDRDPYVLSDSLGLLQAYLQDVGGFLFLGLLFYLLIMLLRPAQQQQANDGKNTSMLMLVCVAVAMLCYGGYIALSISEWTSPGRYGADRLNIKPPQDPTGYVKIVTPKFSLLGYTAKQLPDYVLPLPTAAPADLKSAGDAKQPYPWQALLLTLGGLASVIGASAPFAVGVMKLRWRRIWAISSLTIKEVIRNKVFLGLLLILVPLLFPITWFLPFKAENELKMGVKWVSTIVALLLVLAGKVIASFALPSDVKNQNIYTIVTKPVERFEIVLGRFLGYVCLFTGAVTTVGVLSLTTLFFSNPSAEAKDETQKARVALRGKLSFQSRKADFVGTDVGREFNYRKYIGGDPTSSQRAVYEFTSVPSSLRNAAGQAVPIEFSFDIFRLTKGEENRGVDVNVRVVSWQCGQKPPGTDERAGGWKWTDEVAQANYVQDAVAELRKLPQYAGKAGDPKSGVNADQAVNVLRTTEPGTPEWEVANTLAKKYGFYEYAGKQVFDFHPEKVFAPAGLFENASADKIGAKEAGDNPRVRVFIHCTTPSQMLGMAEGDLYILEEERSFAENYLKSMFGLWCWLVLVIGLAVTLSTYLDGVVTLLAVLFLFVTAFFASYINELGQNIGKGQSGPFASLNQLLQAKQPTAQAENTAAEKAADFLDLSWRWGFRRVVNVLPDVEAFRWTDYVAEGFNVSLEYLIMNLAVMVAYLFPWFLMSYYLIRGREVAA